MPATSVREIQIGLHPQTFLKRIRRQIRDLFRAEEPLVAAGAAGKIVIEAGDVLMLILGETGSTHVVVPGSGIQKFSASFVDVNRPRSVWPIGGHELILRNLVKNVRLPTKMIQI